MACKCNGLHRRRFWKGWNLIFANCTITMVCLCFGGRNKLMYIAHYFVSFSLVPNTEIILKLFDILRIDLAKEFNKQLLRNNTL